MNTRHEASNERAGFSMRLRQALKDAGCSDSPTKLVREFNPLFAGGPVTSHCVRKWLIGEAIPGQDKLRVLADRLCVSVTWLRYGDDKGGSPSDGSPSMNRAGSSDLQLLSDLLHLEPHDRLIAGEFVRILLRLTKKQT